MEETAVLLSIRPEWCGKIQRAFPKAYVTMNFEPILVPRTNTYTNLGNGINHELCMKFVQSGYDLGAIDEGLQEKERQE